MTVLRVVTTVIALRAVLIVSARLVRRWRMSSGLRAAAGRRIGSAPVPARICGAARARTLALGRGADPAVAVCNAAILRVAAVLLAGAGLVGAGHVRGGGPLWVLFAACVGATVATRERRGEARWRRGAAAELPCALEFLAAGFATTGTSAGALVAAADLAPPSLSAVLARASRRAQMGEPAVPAIRREASRLRLAILAEACQTIERDVAVGVPVAERLYGVAREIRARAESEAVARAGKVVPLATLVSAMVIAPACVVALAVLVIAGGIVGHAPIGFG